MGKKLPLLVSMAILAVGFWFSHELQVIAAGVAIFLFGMLLLEEGFTAFTGGFLERILRRCTDRLWKSHLFGFLTTTVMQSSSLVSVIAISFLSAGLIGLTAGVGIIFGANIGTTTGAWLIAGFGMKVKISAYAMPMLVFGLILNFQSSRELKGAGRILAGLGFLFLGIHYMKEGFESFRSTLDLASFAMTGMLGLLVYTLVGVLATVIMQSSHATLLLIIAALASKQITYENALALAIGANIGTTITAILGSISANAAGKRLAAAHLIFNSVTAIIAISFINPFVQAVEKIANFVGIAADDWTLKLALFHTLFNVVGVVVMLPFIKLMVRFLERFFTAAQKAAGFETKFLNEAALQHPDTAVEVLLRETGHLFDNAFEIIAHAVNLHRVDILSDKDLQQIVQTPSPPIEIDVTRKYYGSIKTIYSAIVEFATRARASERMTPAQQKKVDSIRKVCRNIAETVKTISLMKANIRRYSIAANPFIQAEYNRLRKNLASFLRTLQRLRKSDNPKEIRQGIAQMKEKLQELDVLANGTLDDLVRNSRITSEMATSLMNDSSTMVDIGRWLVEIVQRMAIVEDKNLQPRHEQQVTEDLDFMDFLEKVMLDGDASPDKPRAT